jgi:hypothetical protein
MHLVMDTIIAHELELTITQAQIEARQSEWHKALTSTSRSQYIKALMAFVGIELIDYDSAVVHRRKSGDFVVQVRSVAWALKHPA